VAALGGAAMRKLHVARAGVPAICGRRWVAPPCESCTSCGSAHRRSVG